MNCKQQWEHYRSEKARIQKLAKRLGPVAEECNALHSKYDEALAKRVAEEEAKKECRQKLESWRAKKAVWDKCQEYKKAKKAYDDYVSRTQGLYAKALREYESDLAEYKKAHSDWEKKAQAYSDYRSYLAGMSYSIARTWSSTKNKYPFLKNYDNYPTRLLCGARRVHCISQTAKDRWWRECTTVKGLGLPDSNKCHWRYMPVCPPYSKCPTPVSSPGPAPKKPTRPSEPNIVPLEEWLANKGVSVPDNCPVPYPGSRPPCNPNVPLPEVPPKPTCKPPEIPGAPKPPTCKEPSDIFAGVGNMWLLLAAGGAGLYLLTRKK